MKQDKNNSRNKAKNSGASPRIRRRDPEADLLPPLRPNARDKNITMPPEYSANHSDTGQKRPVQSSRPRRTQPAAKPKQSSSQRIASEKNTAKPKSTSAQSSRSSGSQTPRRPIKAQPVQDNPNRTSRASSPAGKKEPPKKTASNRRRENGSPIIRDNRVPDSKKSRSRSEAAPSAKQQIHVPKRAAIIVLCVIVLLALVGFSGYKFIRVENLTVTGCRTYDPNYVISISGIKTGDHIFSLNKKEIAANIDSDPHLIFNDMQYTFPSTVTLIVTERVGACVFVSDGKYIITDSDGYVVEIADSKPANSLPIVTGLALSKADAGQKYETNDSFRKLILEDLLKQIDAQSLSDIITGIDLTDTNSIKLSTKYGITINLGQSDDFAAKLSKASTVLETLHSQGKTSGTLDVSTGESVYRDPYATAQPSASSSAYARASASSSASAEPSTSPSPSASPSAEASARPSSSVTPESSPSASSDSDTPSSSKEPERSPQPSTDPDNQLVG